ncbi:E3 ubiquitin-protein ligase TRIM71-like [Prorops nasuta]|uniref:E3 ubiquitin-protein ligase TRIM71-like n=1 Tax=Prorops nasuta TaxID=863751 RepID=UPI0034CD2D66
MSYFNDPNGNDVSDREQIKHDSDEDLKIASPIQYIMNGYSSLSPSSNGSSSSSNTPPRSQHREFIDYKSLYSLIHGLQDMATGTNLANDDKDQRAPGPQNKPSNAVVSSIAPPSSSLAPGSRFPPTSKFPSICIEHAEAMVCYCRTCSKSVCLLCGSVYHTSHVIVTLSTALREAKSQACQVLHEAKLSITAFYGSLDAVHMATEMLEQKTRQASADVMQCMRRITCALESREKDLIGKIEKARKAKYSALKAREEVLKSGIDRLSKVVKALSEAITYYLPSTDPADLTLRKDMATAEIFDVCRTYRNLPQPEENWISFTGPEGNVLNAINSLGSVVLQNPGPIGDRRAVRGRGSPNDSFSPEVVPYGVQNPIAAPSCSMARDVSRFRTSHVFEVVKIIGNDGNEYDNLCRPWGVACDSDHYIVVADRSNNRIQVYSQYDGSLIRRFGTHGCGEGQFDRPAGVAVDLRNRIIVADKDNHRIQVFTMEGDYLMKFGEKGNQSGQFNYPWDVATNSDCQIVVSDTRNHRVQVFSADGIFLRKFGAENNPSLWKQFDSPRGVTFDREGNIVISDFNNHRLLVIGSNCFEAKTVCESYDGTKFSRPQGVVVDREGNTYICDSKNHTVVAIDSHGRFLWQFGNKEKDACNRSISHSTRDRNGTQLMDRPSGIAINAKGLISVVDFGNNRVLIIRVRKRSETNGYPASSSWIKLQYE